MTNSNSEVLSLVGEALETSWLRGITSTPNANALLGRLACDKTPDSLWGVGPIAPIHLGYDELIYYQKRLSKLTSHTILLADYHAILTHGMDSEDASQRTTYYKLYFEKVCGLNASTVRGSHFQSRADYIELLLSFSAQINAQAVKASFPRPTRKLASAQKLMSGAYIYPLMQCLDALYLGADIVFADHSQRKTYDLLKMLRKPAKVARLSRFPTRDLQRRVDGLIGLWAPVGIDVSGGPLHASTAGSRISIHEDESSLRRKVQSVYAPPGRGLGAGDDKQNALLWLYKYSVFPWVEDGILIKSTENRWTHFMEYDSFESAYTQQSLHPSDCKDALVGALWKRITKARELLGQAVCSWVNKTRAVGGD